VPLRHQISRARVVTSTVIVAVRVKAAPDCAFAAFTQEIGLWWRPSSLFRITPRGDGTLRFEGEVGGRLVAVPPGGEVFEIGKIIAWAPPHELAFTWRHATFTREERTDVTVRFEEIGEETRVTVEHRGWAEIPREHVARHGFPDGVTLQRAAEWWRASLEAMRRLGLPGGSAAL
jgi:uncharacterized protein YndB with AHSA1/START domain